jgi:hypothetical protein
MDWKEDACEECRPVQRHKDIGTRADAQGIPVAIGHFFLF